MKILANSPTESFKRTNNLRSTISFTKDDIRKIIKNLNPNKDYSFDIIGISVLRICGNSILKFVAPVYKKNNKQLIENSRPILLLPVCGNILEQLIYDKIFNFLRENKLISHDQSDFKPGDSRINQLLYITGDIYQ